jgi:hypothetical protein
MAITGLTCGFGESYTRPAVLADHAAGYLPVLHRRVRRHDGRLVMIGCARLRLALPTALIRVMLLPPGPPGGAPCASGRPGDCRRAP